MKFQEVIKVKAALAVLISSRRGWTSLSQKRRIVSRKSTRKIGRTIIFGLLFVSLASPGCLNILSPNAANFPSVIIHFDSKEKLKEFEPIRITDQFTSNSGDKWDVAHYFLLFNEDILHKADIEGVTVLLNQSTKDMVAAYWQYGWVVIRRYAEENVQGELHVFLECGTHTFLPEPGTAAIAADGLPMNLGEEALISALETGGRDMPPHGPTDGAVIVENIDWADVSYSLSKGLRRIDSWLEEESASGFPRTLRFEPLRSFLNHVNYYYFLDPAVDIIDIRSTLDQEGEMERFVPGQLIHISEAVASVQEGTSFTFQYSLRTTPAEPGQMVADLATSEAASLIYFLTGLSLSNDSFRVNLNPEESERIATSNMCSTMVGRIMLEADLQMKKDFCKYENPCESEIGEKYWALLEEKREELVMECMKIYPEEIQSVDNIFFGAATRYWIVPDTITAYEDKDEICVEEATLDIYSEPVYEYSTYEIEFQPTSLSVECGKSLKKAAKEYGQYAMEIEKNLVLPLVVDEVNTDDQYAELRQVYLSLTLAQWYKSHCETCLFSKFIDSADVDHLKAWKGRDCNDIWREYFDSFNNGGYYCEKTEEKGTHTVRKIYRGGGINFMEIVSYIAIIGSLPPATKQVLAAIAGERLHRNMYSYLSDLLKIFFKDEDEHSHMHGWDLMHFPVEYNKVAWVGILERCDMPILEIAAARARWFNIGGVTGIHIHGACCEVCRHLKVNGIPEFLNA
ncbi:MAG: hypothetical protein WBA22_00115 [Candidatus Methanofastidiosia archaeon]